MPQVASPPLDLDQVLREEARQIHGLDIAADALRATIYAALASGGSAALCLSGGGIRSAAFCLGAIQALAETPVDGPARPASMANSLLGRFHYLSTVSGGGYIGSWLSLWIHRDPENVLPRLIGRPSGPDGEPSELSWLRANSNYLTPKLGATSADTWASAALCIRNLLLNWFVILPVLCLVLLAEKWLLVALAMASTRPEHESWTFWVPLLAALAILALSGGLTLRNAPSGGRSRLTQPGFIATVLLPAVMSAFLVSLAFGTEASLRAVGSWDQPRTLFVGAMSAIAIYAVSWGIAARSRPGLRDLMCWLCAGAVHGTLVGVFVFALNHTDSFDPLLLGVAVAKEKAVVLFVYGIPAFLTAHLTAEMVFVGLTAYQRNSDDDREWFGRSAGWFMALAVGWFAAALLAVLVADLVQGRHATSMTFTTLVSGGFTAWLGGSSWSPALQKVRAAKHLTPNIILAIAVPIFAAALIVTGSVLLDSVLLHHPLLQSPLLGGRPGPVPPARHQELFWLLMGVIGTVAVGTVASLNVNVNRFSLHALYRNRLIRAFLGATNRDRHPNPFTQFDSNDNPAMADLWSGRDGWKPLHVVNIALNIVSTRRLAWQERKAESFTVSPLHAGSACKSYRSSAAYGGATGITLGTAMAISGAAVSPNMGYHSSAPISFLMALLNVRLGWWLGNPGPEGNATYHLDGPAIAVVPLLMEAFGLTTDDRKYVYLSDGGHFENLGLYEMVRRRCRFIVVIDAGCDPTFAFEDLGNATRKIWLDLGIAIALPNLDGLRPRPASDGTIQAPYHVTGTIDYASADGNGAQPGRLLYVKPAYHGTESAGIRSYATANPDFPHQTTLDQWFSESQFESYRGLGFEIMRRVIATARRSAPNEPMELAQLFTALDGETGESNAPVGAMA